MFWVKNTEKKDALVCFFLSRGEKKKNPKTNQLFLLRSCVFRRVRYHQVPNLGWWDMPWGSFRTVCERALGKEMLPLPIEVGQFALSWGCQQKKKQFLNLYNCAHSFFWLFWEYQQGRQTSLKGVLGPYPHFPTSFPSSNAFAARLDVLNRTTSGRKPAKISI